MGEKLFLKILDLVVRNGPNKLITLVDKIKNTWVLQEARNSLTVILSLSSTISLQLHGPDTQAEAARYLTMGPLQTA